jgi:hypothetical protein
MQQSSEEWWYWYGEFEVEIKQNVSVKSVSKNQSK